MSALFDPTTPYLTPADYTTQGPLLLAASRKQLEALEQLEGPQSVESVLQPLNELQISLDNRICWTWLHTHTHPDEAMRTAAEKLQQELINFQNQITHSRPLYDTLLLVEIDSTDAPTRRHYEHLLRDFRRAGINLPEATREQVIQLENELVELDQQFARNIAQDVRHITLDSVDELDGLPQDYIESHLPDESGKIRITTDYPDLIPFLSYAHNDARRKELQHASANIAYPVNKPIIEQILTKRRELVQLLGYKDHVHFCTEINMIKTADAARSFVDQIADFSEKRAKAEHQKLLARHQKMDPSATTIGGWQRHYLEKLVLKEDYAVDAQAIRSYLPFSTVRDGIFKLIETLFGLHIRPWETDTTWSPEVTSHELLENGQVIGRFYLDLHPRKDKYNHAAMFGMQSGILNGQLPTAALICNFPGGENPMALMEHEDLITFLHEFGHMMHHILGGKQPWHAQSGVSTEHDFCEVPSQLLEEWAWSPESLAILSDNAEGNAMPSELIDRMLQARNFGTGIFARHQMIHASFSISVYDTDPSRIDLDALSKQAYKKYSLFTPLPDAHGYASFGHITNYGPMYCTYMWSLVISKDVFTRFAEEGLLNRKTAEEYRRAILEPGGSADAEDLTHSFLGRPYSFDAFADWLNTSR